MTDSDKRVALKCPMFENMDTNQIDEFLKTVNNFVREYDKGECVIRRGDSLEYLFIVLDGLLHSYTTYSDGNCVLVCNYESGNVFGEVSLLTNPKYYQFEIFAKKKTRLLLVDHSFLDDDDLKYLQIKTNLMKCLASRASFLNSRMTLLALKTPLMKTAKYILDNEKAGVANLPYNRIDSAEYLNVSRPTLSKELIRLKNMGIIAFKGNRVTVLNKGRLKSLMRGSLNG